MVYCTGIVNVHSQHLPLRWFEFKPKRLCSICKYTIKYEIHYFCDDSSISNSYQLIYFLFLSCFNPSIFLYAGLLSSQSFQIIVVY